MPAPSHPTTLKPFLLLLLTLLLLLPPLPSEGKALAVEGGEGNGTKPILRIETGIHTAVINRIAVDRAGRYLVTGSYDKTVRVWDARTGTLLRTLRPPVGNGAEGRIYAVAITPDGNTIVCGGFTAPSGAKDFPLYLFDRKSGTLLRRVTGLPDVTVSLAVSPDGARVAATLGRRSGVRVFRVADGSPVGADADYGGGSYGADFDPTGSHLVTTCWDGYVRRYAVGSSTLRLVVRAKALGGEQPYSVRFSPDGVRVAVGYADTPAVSVLAAGDLSLRFAPNTAGVKGDNLLSVCWSPDGAALFAGGTASDANYKLFVRRWAGGGAGAFSDTPVADSTLFDLRTAGGTLFYASGEPTLGALDAAAMTRRWRDAPQTLDTRGPTLGLDADGMTAQFSFGYATHDATKQVRFDIGRRELVVRAADNQTMFALGDLTTPPKTEAGGLAVTDWKNDTHPKVNGAAIPLKQNEMSRSLAVAPDGGSFVLGTEWNVRCFGKNGKERWKVAAPGVAWGVNVSGDGAVAAAAFGDGTIRWYRMSDGVELCALFVHADRKRWVLWTPSGYYDCSPGGEDLIGWHLNRGADHEADFFAASQFRGTFYRPDVLAQVLKTKDEAEAMRLADAEKGKAAPAAPVSVAAVLPPVVTITSPEAGASVTGGTVTVRYTVRAPDDAPVTTVRALIDGRPMENARGLDFTKTAVSPGAGGETREIVVRVPARDCEIALVAENKNAPSLPATVRVHFAGTGAVVPTGAGADPAAPGASFVVKPKLYVLAIGVGKYLKPGHDLDFPAKDAADFAAAMKAQQGGLYREVVTKVITDAGATRGEVSDGLDWVQHQTTAKDVAMVFLSGHGANDANGNYFYLPSDFDAEHWKRTGVSFSDIQSSLATIQGKVLFFIDTCHSGNVLGTAKQKGDGVDIVKIVNELSSADNGVVVFAASTGRQVALEDAAWGNGAFTKAVVEAMNGGADYNKDGRITINMLDLYISERVKALTKGTQTPTTTKPATVPDFPVALKQK